jgi:hypothetical protein
MRTKITRRLGALLAAAGLAVLLPVPAGAASGPQPASGTFVITSMTPLSTRQAGGNTIVVVKIDGTATGTFAGPFTETDREVIHPTGLVTLVGKGMQSGTLGTCGTGSARYVTEVRETATTLSGRLQFIDQAGSTSSPMKIHSVDTFTVDTTTGQVTYAGTYHCT